MKRRDFLGMLGIGAATAATAKDKWTMPPPVLGETPKATITRPSRTLIQCSPSPHDLGAKQPKAPFKKGLDQFAMGACATNGRLLAMVVRYNERRHSGKAVADLRALVAEYPEYFHKMRWFFGLENSEGWLDRHIEHYTGTIV